MNVPTELTEKFSSQIKWDTDIGKYKEYEERENKLLAEIRGETKSNSEAFQFNINPKINKDLLAHGKNHKTTIIIFEYFYKTDSDLIIYLLTKNPSMVIGEFDRHRLTIPLEIARGNDLDILLNILASLKEDHNLDVLVNFEDHIEFKLNVDEMLMLMFDPETLSEDLMKSFVQFGIFKSGQNLPILIEEGTGVIGIINGEDKRAKEILNERLERETTEEKTIH